MCSSIMITVTEELNQIYALHFEGEEVIIVKLLRHVEEWKETIVAKIMFQTVAWGNILVLCSSQDQ